MPSIEMYEELLPNQSETEYRPKQEWKHNLNTINLDEIYKNEIEKIASSQSMTESARLRTEVIDDIVSKYFNKDETSVTFRIPKKQCIPNMLRGLNEKIIYTKDADKREDIILDINTAASEIIANCVGREEKDKTTFLMTINNTKNKQIDFLFGNPEETPYEIDQTEHKEMPDMFSEHGRGMPLIQQYMDFFAVKADQKNEEDCHSYSVLMGKKLD